MENCTTIFCHAAYILLKALRDQLNLTIVPIEYYNFCAVVKHRALITTINSDIFTDCMDDIDNSLTISYVTLVFVPPQPIPLSLLEALWYILEVKVWAFIGIFTLLVIITFWFSLISVNGRYKVAKLFEAFSNTMALFFGVGISRIPKNPVMKLFLVIYAVYCIHIQTALTSNLFNLLSVPLYKNKFKTVEEVANAEISICAPMTYKDFFILSEPENTTYSKIKRKVKFYPNEDLPTPLERAIIRRECVALAGKLDFYYETWRLQRNFDGIEDTCVAAGEVRAIKATMVMRKGHYLMLAVNELITRFVESGIFAAAERNLIQLYDEDVRLKVKGLDDESLTLGQLYIFFVIYGIGCCLAVLVFALELVIHKITK
ncbi:hypothetical protein RI129_005856 [Pyrocoelia pectoralis]|uniref:Ionotropic receptor n=1 Tax=Pyrocoelia pectoralis TaxID=417401 RepID=A0AAN7ZNX5_9COLE